MAFCGISHSYEQFYQAIGRCWRFGQKNPVNVHVVIGERERAVLDNVKRKEQEAAQLREKVVEVMGKGDVESLMYRKGAFYMSETTDGKNWSMVNGDCVEEIRNVRDESIDFSVFFASIRRASTTTATVRGTWGTIGITSSLNSISNTW